MMTTESDASLEARNGDNKNEEEKSSPSTHGETKNVHVTGRADQDSVNVPEPKSAHETTSAIVPSTNRSVLNSIASVNSNEDMHRQLTDLMKRLIAQEPTAQTQKEHKFWSTQPVPTSIDDNGAMNEAFEADIPIDQLKQEPYALPKEFEWSLIDMNDEEQKKELYKLLTLNYVEDNDAMFRFDYSAAFLEWALKPPGWKKVWHIGVRVASNQKLVAFISGVPVELMVHGHLKKMVEINFLCVHKKLRSKRLAPVLIKEVTRRVNLEGIFQAVYTAGVVLPTPVAVCRYYHRSLNPKKLLECNFSRIGRNMTMARYLRRYRLPASTSLPGIRPMDKRDVPAVRNLLNAYLAKFPVQPVFTSDAEAEHWLLHKKDVVWSYVVEDPKTNAITDFVSFYSLPSTVIGNKLHKTLNAAYVFYYATDVSSTTTTVCTSSSSSSAEAGTSKEVCNNNEVDTEETSELTRRLRALMSDTLILAKNLNFDVLNALELMDSRSFLENLKFGPGDGSLHYYLYNWKCKAVDSNGIGLMML